MFFVGQRLVDQKGQSDDLVHAMQTEAGPTDDGNLSDEED
jgi:hypothetical protein